MSVAHSFVAAYRGLLRRPLSMSGIVITLTLGVAISVTMFSVLHGVVLGALPYPDSDRIVTIYRENPEQGRRGALTTAEASEALVAVPGFESTAYYTWDVYTLRGDEGPRIVTAIHVSGDYFAVFGAPMALGRALNQSDVAENRPVVVLSHTAWLELTGGDPNAVGRTLSFDRGVYELVGVLPENFGHPLRGYLMYRPMYPLEGGRGSQTYLSAGVMNGVGRLAAGMSATLADEGLEARLAAVYDSYGRTDRGGLRLVHHRLIDDIVGNVRDVLIALFAVALLVLLVACSTAASLVAIRLDRRKAELAVRRALGAGGGRVALDIGLELLFAAVLAAAAGVVLAYLMLDVLRPLAPGNFPRIDDIEINTGVLVFAALVAAGSVLLSGAAPLARVLRVDPIENLRGGMSREIGGRHRIALLPAIGVGLATTALVTALALSMSLMRLGDVDPGFRTANIAALQMFRQGPLASVSPFAERVLEEIRSVPGVRDVVAVSSAPLSVVGRSPIDVAVQGGDLPENIPAVVRHATGGYHRFLGVPIVNGRDISDRDVAGVPNAVVINETLARRAFGTADPLGRTLLLPAITSAERVPFTIVGVSADTRNTGLRAPTEPELIVSVQQVAWNTGVTLLVDSAATSANWLRTLQDAVLRVDPNQPSYRSYMLADDLDAQTRNSRFFASATGWFAMLALLLGAVGVNAVVAAMQRERTREIGLRLALGAAPRKAAALVFSNAARIVALGLVIGVVLAIPAFGWLRDQLFAVSGSAFGALYGVTSVVLILVSFVAASWPAWRAASTAPMEVLRHE